MNDKGSSVFKFGNEFDSIRNSILALGGAMRRDEVARIGYASMSVHASVFAKESQMPIFRLAVYFQSTANGVDECSGVQCTQGNHESIARGMH